MLVRALLGLPPHLLLLLLLVQSHDVHGRQLLATQQEQQEQQRAQPLAVRKMGLDAGEKFYPEHYFSFESTGGDEKSEAVLGDKPDDNTGGALASLLSFGRRSASAATNAETAGERRRDDTRWPAAVRRAARDAPCEDGGSSGAAGNESCAADLLAPAIFQPPFAVHHVTNAASSDSAGLELFRRAADAVARLQRRQWGCPAGTASCSGIGYPYSCCATGETCYKVEDTGLGPVGCCPGGSACGGAVSSCAADTTACPSSLGGGCCIAGYVCKGVGCVQSSSSASTTGTARTTTSTTTSTAAASTSAQPTTVVVTVVVTSTPGGGVTTRTTTITSTPAATATTTTSTSGVAPVKPTLTTTTTTSSAGLPPGYCPTGYYACLASAGGGCCQTGRNCETTSCPPPAASTTIVNVDGVTVVVPATAAAAATQSTSTCAAGWFLCGSQAGPVAGCCPSGYSCGTASCTLVSASSTAEVQKELPSSGSSSSSSSDGRRIRGWPGVVAGLGLMVAGCMF